MPDFKLPDLGEGVTEAEIDKWLVQEGDQIEEDAPLVEVITDKANAEIPSPYAGMVARIHVPAGSIVPVGTVLVTVMNGSDFAARLSSGTAPDQQYQPPPAPPGPGSARIQLPETPAQAEPASTLIEAPGSSEAATGSQTDSERPQAMPPVRRLARSLGIDLSSISGTGPGGRILRSDVEEASKATPTPQAQGNGARHAAPSPPLTPRPGERREPLRGVRRTIAERLSHAHRIVPPVTHVEECDVTELDTSRKLANERSPELPKLTYMPFIVKAVVAALKAHDSLNASLDEATNEIVFHPRLDIGIAVDTPQGLMVPVIRAADQKRLREITEELNRLTVAARDGKLTSEDLRDPTFTVSSPGGNFGGLLATPIVPHPQSAILGVHRAIDKPVVRDGQIVIRKIMNLTVTYDHRILDGMTGAKFILEVVRLLEHPAVLALES